MQTPWGECAVFDAHTHLFSLPFFQALAAQRGASAEEVAATLGWQLPPEDPAELAAVWAAELDKHGVSRAALIASMPGDEASALAAAAAFPGRFYAYAMVNPLNGAAILPGLRAACFFPAMHRYSIQDDRAQQAIDQAAAQGCAIFVHCGVLTVGARSRLGLPAAFDMRFSNPLDLHSAAVRHPQTAFVIPHFGAGYFREALMLADLCPNVYLDTSSTNSWMRYEELDLRTVFRRALAVAGARRLLFGTDSSFFPRGWNYEIFEAQTRVLLDLGIAAADAALILGKNLERILENS